MTRIRSLWLSIALGGALAAGLALDGTSRAAGLRTIEVWHGDTQRVGHLGDAQDDINILGHIEPWREVDRLSYRINAAAPTPLSFRAYRRLVSDGDFNADVPIGRLKPGENAIEIEATFRDGETLTKTVTINRESGSMSLPVSIQWKDLKHFQDAGQAVDGRWEITPQGLRTRQVGYDRVFLIGERDWQDYDVRTTVTIHDVPSETTPLSGGNGLGILPRFQGHVTGGPRHFPSGQPKWGYQPFGSIGWLRWDRGKVADGPHLQFYGGDSDARENHGRFPIEIGERYGMRYRCETLPDAPDGSGVTRYQFKVWKASTPEPSEWAWEQIQTSKAALRRGGIVLLAHHVDATFGDVEIQAVHGR